ncbi:UNC93-like protein MFSD11 [Bolinopsis microptera]|uniref:UNC93-like protein MFSD11 n=1 Tax=Bolinopsis microptera TaxID=2820187 RepID=UPI003079F41F
MGVGFMFIFSATFTASFIEVIVFKDFNRHGIDGKTGFYALSLTYGCLGLANWFAPAVVNKLGCRISLFLSAIPYIAILFSLVNPYLWSLFTLTVLVGAGGGVLWTANGEVIAKNSPGDTKAKNTGIFWSWYCTSMLLGNFFLYFYLGNSEKISDAQRHVIYLVLGVFCAIGMCCFLLLAPSGTPQVEDKEESSYGVVTEPQSVLQPIINAAKFCKTWQMGFLYAPIIFAGVSENFWTSVFTTVIGNVYPDRSYMALGGMCTGIGEISAGFIWGRLTSNIGRHGVIMCSTVINCCLYYLAFISFPFDAATTTASIAADNPIIPSNIYLTMAMGVMLGLGDGGFCVSIYAALSTIFEENPAPAFGVYNFVKCTTSAVAFLYCGHLLLPFQLGILAVTCLVGCVCFITLERYPSQVLLVNAEDSRLWRI